MVLSLETVNQIPKCIQLKSVNQYFPLVLFIMLYKMVLAFYSVDEMLKCDHRVSIN